VFNAQIKYGGHPGPNAFGVNLEKQLMIVKETSEVVSKMTVGNHKSPIPFQKGFFSLLVSEGVIIDSRTDPRSRISLPWLIIINQGQ
jgi:hypothetical protein